MARDQIRPIKTPQPTLFPTLNSSSSTYYTVSGTITPDATGNYFYGGIHNTKAYYTNGVYYIYWDGIVQWLISNALNDSPTDLLSFFRLDSSIVGEYVAESEATGTPLVTETGERLVEAPGEGRSLQITGLVLSSATTQNITLTDGTDAIFGPIYLTENVPVTLNFPHTIQVGDNKPLHALISSTGATAIQVWGYIDS